MTRSSLSLRDSGQLFGSDDSWVFDDSDSFESEFSQSFEDNREQGFVNETSSNSSDDDDDFNLPATIAQIELQRKNFLPEYFELLQ